MIDGVTMQIAGREWVIPPLNLKQLKKLGPKLNQIPAGPATVMPTEEQLGNILELIHSALSRNYPDLTLDEVEDMIDLGNMVKVIQAVMGISGLVSAKAGERVPGSQPTGVSSTDTLQPQQVGLGEK
jgi:hypothetical protein